MNCFSSGRDVNRRCKSVCSNSVTMYLSKILEAALMTGWLTYMSSSGEMKISLRLMRFSCLKCFNSLSSRYVRFDSTAVLKGLLIFLMATC